MLTTRQALTGPWAGSLRTWGSTAIPGSVVVVVQELPVGYPDAWFVVASAVLQFVLPGAWMWLVATVARRLTGEVPPIALAVLWLGVGLVRGAVGGAVALSAGLDPEWAFRLVFWCALAVIWSPLLTYALAQAEEYRRLLARRAALTRELDEIGVWERETSEARAERMKEAVADALGPAVDEVRAGLRAAAFDAADVAGIQARLDELTARARHFTIVPAFAPEPPPGRASLVAAMSAFQARRPVFAGLLTAVAVAPLMLLEEFRDGGPAAVAEMAVGVAIATIAFMLVGAGTDRLHALPGPARFALLRVGTLLAGGLGVTVVALLPWNWLPEDAFLALALMPVLFSAAADILSTAVGLEATNVRLEELLAAQQQLALERTRGIQEAEERASAQLLELIRGDLSGRLASCAMALAFLAAGAFTTTERERIVGTIVDQLDTASARLRELRT